MVGSEWKGLGWVGLGWVGLGLDWRSVRLLGCWRLRVHGMLVHCRFRVGNVWIRRWVLLNLGLDGHGRDEVRASWKREVRI